MLPVTTLVACDDVEQPGSSSNISVKTVGVSEIYSDRASVTGRCETTPDLQISECGFIYSGEDNVLSESVGVKIKAETVENHRFAALIPNLEPEKNYYVMAYATDATGDIYYGSPVAFVTTKIATIDIDTPEVVSVTAKTAVLSGQVTKDSGVPAFAFGIEIGAYGSQPDDRELYTIAGAPSYIVTDGGTFEVEIPLSAGLLTPGTAYTARMYAQNDATGSYTGEFTFDTPEVEAAQVLTATKLDGDAEKTYLTLTSKLVSTGNDPATVFGVAYKEDAAQTDTPDETWIRVASSLAATEGLEYQIKIEGLTHSTDYGIAAYATNDHGTVYGSVLVASTETQSDPAQAPYQYTGTEFESIVTPLTERNVGADYIYLRGVLTAGNGHELTAAGFYLADNAAMTGYVEVAGSMPHADGTFFARKEGLLSPQRYYYKTWVENSEGVRFESATMASTSTAIIYDRDGSTPLYLLLRTGAVSSPATFAPSDTPLYYYELAPIVVSMESEGVTSDYNFYFLDRNLGATEIWPAGTFNADGSLTNPQVSTANYNYIGYYFYFGYKTPATSSDAPSGTNNISNNYGWASGRVGANPWNETENPCPKGYNIPTKEELSSYITAVTGTDGNFNKVLTTLNIGVSGQRGSNNGNLNVNNGNATVIPLSTDTGYYDLQSFESPLTHKAPSGTAMPVRCLRIEKRMN
jgi:hypothetical protein